MINGFAARKHDVATLKEALQIARAAIKDIQKDNCLEYFAWSHHTKKNPSTGLGKCLRAGGLEGLFSWLFRQRLLTSILICATKLIIYMII